MNLRFLKTRFSRGGKLMVSYLVSLLPIILLFAVADTYVNALYTADPFLVLALFIVITIVAAFVIGIIDYKL